MVRAWEVVRGGIGLRHLVETGVSRGIDGDVLLAGTGLTRTDVADPALEVAVWQELAAAGNLERVTDHSSELGLELGQRLHVSGYGAAGLVMLSSASVRAALDFARRHSVLLAVLSHTTIHRHGKLTSIVFDGDRLPEQGRRTLIERDMVAAVVALREMTGASVVPRAVTFEFARTRADTSFAEHLGVSPHYRKDVNAVTLSDSVLDAALPQADEHACWRAASMCAELAARRREAVTVAAQVRNRLLARPTLMTLEQTATAMATTSRTLRRRLAEEGTTFRHLVDEARRATALHLIAHTRLSVEQVAARIGYADTSAFTHAFRRWTGAAPRAYRSARAAAGTLDMGLIDSR